MPVPSDLVHETTITTGTGALTLVNVNGKRSFTTAFGTGGSNVFWYFVSSRDAAEWEIGTGHVTAGTLVRDTVVSSSNANAAVSFSAGTKDICNDVPAALQGREIVTVDRDYWVRTADGNDANTGLANTAAAALKTVQAAVDLVCTRLDIGANITINVVGAVSENIVLKTYLGSTTTIDPNWGCPTGVKILGDRSSLVAAAPLTDFIMFEGSFSKTPWLLDGFSFSAGGTAGSWYLLSADNTAAVIYIGKVNFGSYPSGPHMNGNVRATENYTISGPGKAHRFVGNNGFLICDSANFNPITVTLSGTPNFTGAFYFTGDSGEMIAYGVTFAGSGATGNAMKATENGIIQTYGVGATYCPGSGSVTATQGQII